MQMKVEEVTLAAGVAENFQIMTSLRWFLTISQKPPQQLLDNLTSYGPFLPDSLFQRQADQAGRAVPNEVLAAAMEGKVGCLQCLHVALVETEAHGRRWLISVGTSRRRFASSACTQPPRSSHRA